jgi:hypothetical protein
MSYYESNNRLRCSASVYEQKWHARLSTLLIAVLFGGIIGMILR